MGKSHQQLGKGQGSRLVTEGQDSTEQPLSSSLQPVSAQGGAGTSHSESRGPQQGWVKRESLPQGAEAKVNRDKAVAQQLGEQRAGCCHRVRGRKRQWAPFPGPLGSWWVERSPRLSHAHIAMPVPREGDPLEAKPSVSGGGGALKTGT